MRVCVLGRVGRGGVGVVRRVCMRVYRGKCVCVCVWVGGCKHVGVCV